MDVPVTQRLLGCWAVPRGLSCSRGCKSCELSLHSAAASVDARGGSPRGARAWGGIPPPPPAMWPCLEGRPPPDLGALNREGEAPLPGAGSLFRGEHGSSDVPCQRTGGAFMSPTVPGPAGCGTTNTSTKQYNKIVSGPAKNRCADAGTSSSGAASLRAGTKRFSG